MTEVTDHYFHSHTYEAVIDQLENIARTFDPAAPDDLRTRIIEAVGELGAWPAYAFTGPNENRPVQKRA